MHNKTVICSLCAKIENIFYVKLSLLYCKGSNKPSSPSICHVISPVLQKIENTELAINLEGTTTTTIASPGVIQGLLFTDLNFEHSHIHKA